MAKLTLSQSPKFKVLVRTLCIPIAHVRGHLEMLWESAHWRDDPYYSSIDEVEASAEWVGEVGLFGRTLLDRGWIDIKDNGYVLHDYEDHIPSYVKDRRRKADYRKTIHVKSKDCPGTVVGQSHQEKRREENEMKENEKKLTSSSLFPSRFDEFWKAYPSCQRKSNKQYCQKIWKSGDYDDHIEWIVKTLDRMKQTIGWLRDNGDDIPMPSTWLNQRRWVDNQDDLDAIKIVVGYQEKQKQGFKVNQNKCANDTPSDEEMEERLKNLPF